MSQLIHIDIEYSNWISSLSERYRQSQIKAFSNVNREMLRFYWELGSDIVRLKAEEKWPDNFWKNLHQDLSESLNGIGGLSVTNLQYTKRFFLLYNQLITNNPQVVGDLFLIPWGHHRLWMVIVWQLNMLRLMNGLKNG